MRGHKTIKQVSGIKEDITAELTDIKRIMKDCCEDLFIDFFLPIYMKRTNSSKSTNYHNLPSMKQVT